MERLEGLSKIEFKEILSLATKQSYFIFNPTKVGGLGGWGVGVHGPMSPPLLIYLSSQENHFYTRPALMLPDS